MNAEYLNSSLRSEISHRVGIRELCALVLVGAAAITMAEGADKPAATDRAMLDEALQAAIERTAVPGVVAMAVDRRGVIYQGAFGTADASASRAMTVDAIFNIASMTKPLTTVALLQLMEAGRISLDDRAARYLPELSQPVKFESFDPVEKSYQLQPAVAPITVRHLVTHTAGFGYSIWSTTLRDFTPRAGEKYETPPLLFEPGTQWAYSTGIDYVGRIVEALSGRNLEDYFRERILGPLGMHDTAYNVPHAKQGRIVSSHRRLADETLVQSPRAAPRVLTKFNGGGGLYSTAPDYIRFLQMVLNGGSLGATTVISPETVEAMGRNQIGAIGVRAHRSALLERSRDLTFIADGRDKWGLGFLITSDDVPGKRAAGSLSWGGINNTYFWIDPKRGVAGVILMQFVPFADPKALAVHDAFERAVYRVVEGTSVP